LKDRSHINIIVINDNKIYMIDRVIIVIDVDEIVELVEIVLVSLVILVLLLVVLVVLVIELDIINDVIYRIINGFIILIITNK
jgi:hypothetical protein